MMKEEEISSAAHANDGSSRLSNPNGKGLRNTNLFGRVGVAARVCQNLRERDLMTYHLAFNLRDFSASQHADAMARLSQPNNQVRREKSRAESTE
jgi:hypothetical protein